MDRSLLGKVMMGLGIVLVMAGVVGLVTGGDDAAVSATPGATSTTGDVADSTTSAAAPSSTSTTTTTSSTTTTTSTSTTSTTSTTTTTTTTTTGAPVAAETAEEFFAVLKDAIDNGPAATLLERMNQATLARYGADQCEAYADSIAGAGLPATLVATNELESWDYTTDDVTTSLADVVAADLETTAGGQVVPQTTHWKLVDGRYTWFTDCGTPV